MAISNTSEKSNALDREENITKGSISAKKVALYVYNSGTDELEVFTGSSGGGGGAVTIADGDDAALGAKADASATTDTGTFSLIGLFKRLLEKITTLNAKDFATSAKQLADNHQVTVSNSSIPVTDNGGSLTVDGTVGATQSGTWTVQPGNTANTTAWKVDGSAVTQPVSGTFWQATQPVSLASVPSHAVTNAGTFAVQVTSAPTTAVTGTFWQATQPVSLASVPSHAVTNAGTFAVQATLQTGSNVIGSLTANQSVNISQMNGVTTSMGNGVSGTGVQRVTIASDSTGQVKLAANSGVDIGDVDVTSIAAGTNVIGGVNPTPSGASAQALSNDTSTAYEASSVTKASAGTVYGVTGYNSKTSAQFFQFFNSTTVPADATAPVITIRVAAQSNFSIDFGVYGRRFSTGISWSNSSTGATKTIGSADMFVDVNYV